MATRTWNGDVNTQFSNAANWSDNTAPVSGDTVVFDSSADANAVLVDLRPSSGEFAEVIIENNFDQLLSFQHATAQIKTNKLTIKAKGKIQDTTGGKITFVGGGTSGVFVFFNHADMASGPLGMFDTTLSRTRMSFDFSGVTAGTAIKLENGVYPNILLTGTGNNSTFSPTAVTAAGTNTYPTTDILTFQTDSDTSIIPATKNQADLGKIFRIHGGIYAQCADFNWGNTTLEIQPQDANGSKVPYNGAYSASGNFRFGTTGKIFKAKYNHLRIAGNIGKYFEMDAGAILSVNKLTILPDARFYGPDTTVNKGAEIQCVELPTILGDWNFAQIAEGIYRSRSNPPPYQEYHSILANNLGSNGQVLAIASDGSLEWSSSAGGGADITVQDEGSALSTAATTLNFVGNGVVASGSGATKTITITDTDTNTQLSQEQVEDFVNGVMVGGTNLTKTYDDTAGTLTLDVDDAFLKNDADDATTGTLTAAGFAAGINGVSIANGHADFQRSHQSAPAMTVEQDGTGDIAVFKGASDELLTIRRAGSLKFSLSQSGGAADESIMTYRDEGGNERNFISINGQDTSENGQVDKSTIVIHNRGPNGDVEIRGNSGSAGSGGETSIATFEDTLVTLKKDTLLQKTGSPTLSIKTASNNSQQANLTLQGARNEDGNPFAQISFSNKDDNAPNTDVYVGARIIAFNDGANKGGGLQFQTVPSINATSPALATALTIQEDTNIVTAGNLTVGGNLIVSGDSITVNAETITTEEAMLSLGIGQTATDADALDFGFYGTYDVSDTQKYRGLFADASDSGKFKLFKDLEAEPTTTVNVSGTGYAVGTLVANLEGNVTGNVTGVADSATVATRVVVTDNESTDESNALVFVADADVDGALDAALESDGDLTYNPSTGVVTATGFAGALTGDVTGNVTGNVSGSAGSATGNAATATALETARNIGGVSFDGTANIDLPGVNTGGNQDTTGNADSATLASTVTITDNNETDETVYPVFVDGATGTQGLETEETFNFNPGTGILNVPQVVATGFTGGLIGNVTGNVSGSAATVTGATQSNITSLGTLTGLTSTGTGDFKTGSGFALIIGADVNATTVTDDNRKFARMGILHYDTDEEPVTILTADANELYSRISIGGGTSGGNAPSQIFFHTAADTTTTSDNTATAAITSTGLGIGTISPAAKLQIAAGSNPASAALMSSSSLAISSNDGNLDLLSYDDNTTVANNIAFKRFVNSAGGALIHTFGITHWVNTGSVGSNTGDRMAFNYGTNANPWNNTELLTIESGGNVGIGNTSPGTSLHVSDAAEVTLSVDSSNAVGSQISLDATGTGGHEWRLVSAANGATGITDDTGAFGLYSINGSSNGYKLVVEGTTGKIGMGTTSPAFPLHLKYTDNDTTPQGGSTSGSGTIGSGAEGGGLYIENASQTDGSYASISFRTDTADARIAWQSVGSSLINEGQMSFYCDTNDADSNTPSSVYTLEEVFRLRGGSSDSDSAQAFNSAYVNGRLGVGTASPAHPLDVSGNIKTDNKLFVSDSFLRDDGANFKVVGESQTQYQVQGQYGAHIFYTQDGSSSAPNNYTSVFKVNYVGNLELGNNRDRTIFMNATAHDTAGKALIISAGNTTAGTTDNVAGGDLIFEGGQGKGTGAGGEIVFKVANAGAADQGGDQSYPLNSLATAMTIADDAKVGIGTTSPSMPFHVESADNNLALFKSTDANAGIQIDTPDDGYAVVFFSEAGTNKWSLGKTASASDAFSIYDESNNRAVMQISANNTVTFNKNNVSTADFIIEAQGNSNMFRLDSSQSNIGIGMAPPSGHAGQTVVMTVRGDDDGIALMLQNSAADADDGPEMVLYRNSASPAADDLLGRIRFDGEDSGDNIHTYFRMTSAIKDPTDASEDGRFIFENRVGGVLNEVMRFEGIDVKIPTDSGKLYLGASDDLEIYHDGSNSYVADAGTGELRLLGSNIKLRNAAGNEEYITCVDNGEVILYHNNSAKLTTSSVGVTVTGKLSATTKSFDIEHPTKEGMRLHHGSLEGPEHGVYIRGKNNSGTIHLPDYWKGLVDEDTITVQLTAIGKPQELYVREIKNNRVRVAAKTRGTHLNYFYFIQAERKDVEKMVVEY